MAIDNDAERTNTLALLLPHLALFEPPIQTLLKDHYSQYGEIVHWAPVKGFGRVIVVYRSEDDALLAKQKGDRLRLDVDLPDLPSPPSERQSPAKTSSPSAARPDPNDAQATPSAAREANYFTSRHRRRKSYQARKGWVNPSRPVGDDLADHAGSLSGCILYLRRHSTSWLVNNTSSRPNTSATS